MITSENSLIPSLPMPSLSRFDNEASLDRVREMASALMSVSETAFILDMSSEETDEFIYQVKNNLPTPLAKAFNLARLERKLELRKKIIDLALKGSPSAQPIAEEYLSEDFLP